MIIYELTDKVMQDHKKIEKFLEKMKPTEENKLKLKFLIEKHFILEEKAIFELYYTDNKEDAKLVPILMKQHKEILEEIKKAEDFQKLKQMIKKHSQLEDEKFYPLLDKTLTRERKEEIIEKIQSF